MAEANLKPQLEAIRPADFALMAHKNQTFTCVLPTGVTKEDIENPELYVNIARKVAIADEIRVIAEDMSFVAWVIVTAAFGGSDIRVRVTHGCDLDDVEDLKMPEERYQIKMRGMKKWSIIDIRDGAIIKEGIATQKEAQNERDDYIKALAR